MKQALLSLFMFIATTSLWAQGIPLVAGELTDTKPHHSEAEWARVPNGIQMAWGSTDCRYPKLNVPQSGMQHSVRLNAWAGERVMAQAVVWTRNRIDTPHLTVSNLVCGKNVIPTKAIQANFVGYVMTDELNHTGKSNCGHRPNKADYDSSMVADMIYGAEIDYIPRCSTRPVWVSVWVPVDTRAGIYKGKISLTNDSGEKAEVALEIKVGRRRLPEPSAWAFDLDLWQNPYAVARVMNVKLWSKEHFSAMLPVMKMLANAGQKSITASIMHHPWNGQTQDAFNSMVQRTLTLDGQWKYNYTVFDRWVEFMTNEVGITGTIDCYTMIPWALQFDYYDQASNTVKFINACPQDSAYSNYWLPFLRDFARHLRQRRWFERTAISMDERQLADMQSAIAVIRQADPDFRITLAGNYHKEIDHQLADLSVPYGQPLDQQVISQRRSRVQSTTCYICCTESFPNTFTFSDPAEAAFIPIHAIAQGYDGLLRWAYNSWTLTPMQDSRFRSWPAGDTYIVYPGGRSSMRFERLIEGIQCCEKIRILRAELKAKGNRKALQRIDNALKPFQWGGLEHTQMPTGERISRLQQVLNNL